ncbi:MAG: hypothetical protein ACRC8S_15150 [Fimbriiglobus sp.]
MRWKLSLLGLSVAPFLSGCNLFYYAGHNAINEPITRLDEHKVSTRLTAEARKVWKEVCKQFPAKTFTPEFADGFTDGYADHMENGGPAVPPTIPPLRYRRSSYLTPHGHALIRDYMVGFQYGAEVAIATGKRQFLTVPVLLPEQTQETILDVKQFPAPPETSTDKPKTDGAKPAEKPMPNPMGLPAPKPLDNLGAPVPPKQDEGAVPKNPAITPPATPPTAAPTLPINPGPPGSALPNTPAPKAPIPMPEVPKVDVPKVNLPQPAKPLNLPSPGNSMPIVDASILPSSATSVPVAPSHEPPAPLPPVEAPPAPLPPLPEPPVR